MLGLLKRLIVSSHQVLVMPSSIYTAAAGQVKPQALATFHWHAHLHLRWGEQSTGRRSIRSSQEGCMLVLWEVQRETEQNDFVSSFMVTECSCFCIVCTAHYSRLYTEKTLETQNASLTAAGRSGCMWQHASVHVGGCSVPSCTETRLCPCFPSWPTVLSSPGSREDSVLILSADKAGGGMRSPLFSGERKP